MGLGRIADDARVVHFNEVVFREGALVQAGNGDGKPGFSVAAGEIGAGGRGPAALMKETDGVGHGLLLRLAR
jgi:hypothetical protein